MQWDIKTEHEICNSITFVKTVTNLKGLCRLRNLKNLFCRRLKVYMFVYLTSIFFFFRAFASLHLGQSLLVRKQQMFRSWLISVFKFARFMSLSICFVYICCVHSGSLGVIAMCRTFFVISNSGYANDFVVTLSYKPCVALT